MKALWLVGGTALAIAVQTTLARFLLGGTVAVDLVLVVVVYAALTYGPVTGLLTGTFAGLVQDALSSGIIGIGGLAKTVVGFLAGVVGTQFIIAQPPSRFVAFFMATVVHAAIFIGLYVLLDLRDTARPYLPVIGQAAANAIVGVLIFQLVELLPGAVERKRLARNRVRRSG
jgi:rod shape-determining protein MreD